MVQKPAVFISSTGDLRSARKLVAEVLYAMGYDPHTQDVEPTDGGELVGVLRQWVEPCGLMVQLVGRRYGAEPPAHLRPAGFGRASYTQFEALYFERTLGRKVIYVFLDPAFPTDRATPEPPDLTALQAAYMTGLANDNRLRHEGIATREALELCIRRLDNQLAALREQAKAQFGQVTGKLDDQSEQLARIEKLLLAQRQANPQAEPTLSAADRALLERAKHQGDLESRAAASVLRPDADTDALLAELQARHDAEAFDLAMLQGKRWYFDKHPQYDKAIPPFERAMALRPDSIAARTYAALAHNGARLGGLAAHQKRAIDLYEGTLRLVPSRSADWAMTQNNLGNAWSDLPTGDRAGNLATAIACYEAALTVRTRDAAPADWAATQNNLGNAWGNLPTGDRAGNLATAIACYEAALTVYTRDAAPADWAMTQYNLALAFADLAEQPGEDRVGRLRRAIACGKAALTVRTAEAFPREHANTAKNLAIDRRTYEAAGGGGKVAFDDIRPAE